MREQLFHRSTSHAWSETPPRTDADEDEERHYGSLDDLRLSDSEISAFRRDDKGRISITKKSESMVTIVGGTEREGGREGREREGKREGGMEGGRGEREGGRE